MERQHDYHLKLSGKPQSLSFFEEGLQFGAFEENQANDPDFIAERLEQAPVADHEAGHALVVQRLGHFLKAESIIKKGRVLGYVMYQLNPKEFLQNIWDLITIAMAGKAAELKAGITDHSGCGSDMNKAFRLAAQFKFCTGTSRSPAEIVSDGLKRASSLFSYSEQNTRKWFLIKNQEKVYS